MSEILRSAAVALLAIVYLFFMHAFAFAQEVDPASSLAAHLRTPRSAAGRH